MTQRVICSGSMSHNIRRKNVLYECTCGQEAAHPRQCFLILIQWLVQETPPRIQATYTGKRSHKGNATISTFEKAGGTSYFNTCSKKVSNVKEKFIQLSQPISAIYIITELN